MCTASFCKLYEPVQLFCGQLKYLPIRPQESDVGSILLLLPLQKIVVHCWSRGQMEPLEWREDSTKIRTLSYLQFVVKWWPDYVKIYSWASLLIVSTKSDFWIICIDWKCQKRVNGTNDIVQWGTCCFADQHAILGRIDKTNYFIT